MRPAAARKPTSGCADPPRPAISTHSTSWPGADPASRGKEAERWRRRIIEAGNSAGVPVLADRLDQSNHAHPPRLAGNTVLQQKT
jgi:hypothetical protein